MRKGELNDLGEYLVLLGIDSCRKGELVSKVKIVVIENLHMVGSPVEVESSNPVDGGRNGSEDGAVMAMD